MVGLKVETRKELIDNIIATGQTLKAQGLFKKGEVLGFYAPPPPKPEIQRRSTT